MIAEEVGRASLLGKVLVREYQGMRTQAAGVARVMAKERKVEDLALGWGQELTVGRETE